MANSNTSRNSNQERPDSRSNSGQHETNSNSPIGSASNQMNQPDNQNDDVESLSDQLSPTDGYFNNGRSPIVPPDMLIPDPNQQSAAEASKVREAREEAERERAREREEGYKTSGVERGGAETYAAARGEERKTVQHTSSHVSHSSYSSGRRRFGVDEDDDDADGHRLYTERTPLMSQPPPTSTNAPPPTYSAATEGSTPYHSPTVSSFHHNIAMSHASRDSGYNTLSGRRDVLSGSRTPEDLGGREEEGGDSDDEWWGFGKDAAGWRGWLRWILRPQTLIIAIALIIGVGFIAGLIMNITKIVKKGRGGIDIPGGGIGNPNGDPYRFCPTGVLSYTESFPFQDPSSFEFLNLVEGLGYSLNDNKEDAKWTAVQTGGEVNVWPAKNDTTDDVQVLVQLHYSHNAIMQDTSIDRQSDLLQVYTPSHIALDRDPGSRPCIYVEVHIWLRPGLTLHQLGVKTQSLKIIVHEDLKFTSREMYFGSISGSIVWPGLNSLPLKGQHGEIKISIVSGSVKGTIPLFNGIKIGAYSGSVSIDLDLRKGNTFEAVLEVSTISGSVHIDTPAIAQARDKSLATKIPNRNYRTMVNSSSGALRLNLLHRSETLLATHSGSINTHLTLYGCVTCESIIDTETISGATDITVLPSLSNPSQSIRSLKGDYKFQMGSMRITYPRQWEGRIEGEFMSASFATRWPGLRNQRIVKDGQPPITKYFAEVGSGGSGQLHFHGSSGSIRLSAEGGREWYGGGVDEDDVLGPIEIPVKKPEGRVDEPDWEGGVGVPPPSWPGYEDEWDFQRKKSRKQTSEVVN
ncbi:MAG: hypothetical protein MMC33_001452 [Icmadophila ericetorum]|nr:hypothetical protein [Icmadophila ericetorum]